MGLVDFLLGSPPVKPQVQATASIAIPYYQNNFLSPFNTFRINRSDAMQVPAVARARNIIAGTIATLAYDPLTKLQANRSRVAVC